MRIIFIDMHCNNFLVRVYPVIKQKNKVVKTFKYKYLVDYALSHKIEIFNYITGEDSCLRGYRRLGCQNDQHKRLARWEHNYVMRNSYDSPMSISPMLNADEILDDDIVIGFLKQKYQLELMSQLKGHHVLMGNHFVSINAPVDLGKNNVKAFVNEIDLSDNPFVKQYIRTENVKQIVCPYIYAKRFRNLNRDRKNKMLAIGTSSTCAGNKGYKLYRDFFGTEWIQPMRKEIMDKAPEFPEEIDSCISYIFEDKIVINDTDNVLIKLIKKIRNKYSGWSQTQYMSFDMVEKFNEYKFFACPEELVGMPGIGFVEGMACGTAYIGVKSNIYKSLGLIEGEHYIGYDGTFEDLIDKIHYCQNHADVVERIALNGMKYVREHYNEETVAENFFKELSKISE